MPPTNVKGVLHLVDEEKKNQPAVKPRSQRASDFCPRCGSNRRIEMKTLTETQLHCGNCSTSFYWE